METIDKNNLVMVRQGVPDDAAFIYSTWLKSLRYGNSWFELIDQDTYFKKYHDIIEAILSKPETDIRVACLKEDPSVILGYSILRDNNVDWVFVKKAWRNIGIAKSLVPENINVVTHMTKVGLSIFKKRKGMRFDPFINSQN